MEITKLALDSYLMRLARARKEGNRIEEAGVLGAIGILYKMAGKIEMAMDYHIAAFSLRREIGDKQGEAIALFNFADALAKLGDQADAISNGERALAILKRLDDPYAEMVEQQLVEWRSPPARPDWDGQDRRVESRESAYHRQSRWFDE